jgi:hypothetical protein
MDDAERVRGRERRGDRRDDPDHLVLRKSPSRLLVLLEGGTEEELFSDVERAVGAPPHLENRHHVRVRELRGGLRLAPEAAVERDPRSR